MQDMFPQVAFYIGSVPIYDTVVSTWVMIALIALIAWLLGKRCFVVL